MYQVSTINRGEDRANQGVLNRGDAHSSMGLAPVCLFSRVCLSGCLLCLVCLARLPACLQALFDQKACAPVKFLFIRDGTGARSSELLIASIDYSRNFTAFRGNGSFLVRIVVDSDTLHFYQRFGYYQKVSYAVLLGHRGP